MSTALDEGFTHFDTARMYGEGMAEASIGKFLTGGLRKKVTIATKFGIPASPLIENFPALIYPQRVLTTLCRRSGWKNQGEPDRIYSPEGAEASLKKSLNALRTDWLDIFFVHEPRVEDLPKLEDLAEWLVNERKSGRIRYSGLAGNANNCAQIAKQLKGAFDVLQVEDSL